MARKTANYTATDGRDAGKRFIITEMSAAASEDWALRVMLALVKNNVDLPEGALDQGMAGLASMGVSALGGINIEDARPLLAEMLLCVQIQPNPDPTKTHFMRALIEDDIEEVVTRLKLRKEVLNLHVDFSKAVAPLMSRVKAATGNGRQVTATSRRR